MCILVQQYIKRIILCDQVDLFQRYKNSFNISIQSCNVMHYIKNRKGKNHMNTAIDTEKSIDKVKHALMRKTLIKVATKGTYFNVIKISYDNTTAKPHSTINS